MNALRLFIALSFSADVKERCAAIQDRGRKQLADIRWISPQQLHLTLVFLGKVLKTEQVNIEHIMRETAAKYPPFTLEFSGLGVFPRLKSPKVLWAGLAENPVLMALQEELMLNISNIPFDIETRPFRPHLTLGRIRQKIDIQALGQWIAQEKNVSLGLSHISSFDLIESQLTPQGARYIPRLTVKLKPV